MLHYVLGKYDLLFDITLGTWKTQHVDIELQPDSKPYHNNIHPVLREHKDIFNN